MVRITIVAKGAATRARLAATRTAAQTGAARRAARRGAETETGSRLEAARRSAETALKEARRSADIKAREIAARMFAETQARQIRFKKLIAADKPITELFLPKKKEVPIIKKARIKKTRQRLESTAKEKGIIFLKRQELGITKTEERKLTSREKQATEDIKRAEEILGIKDSGAGFIIDPKTVPITAEESIQSAIKGRISKLNELQRQRKTEKTKRKIITLGSDIKTIKEVARRGETFALGVSSAVISNVAGIVQLPKTAKKLIDEIKEDPKKNIVGIGKRIPNVLRKEKVEFIDLYRVSPTEAVGNIAGQLVFFAGTGKVLKVVGKLGKIPAKAVRTALKGKKGTKIKLIGTQGIVGDKIITKIIFAKGKRQIGGAIGVSVVKGKKVFTQVVGKVGKVGKIRKKFIEKAVFVGREISISKSQRFKLTSQLKKIQKFRKLTKTEKQLFTRLRGKKKTIRLSRDLEGILQVGVGKIAQAPGTKLLRTTIRFPTGQLKKIQAKGLKIKDFVSFSTVFTRKDLSLIIGKTLTKKKNIVEFIGLIKGTSPKTFKSFSVGKQKLFSRALKDVVGVATATTTRSRTIIPKLSPKAKSLIIRSTGITIAKVRVIPRPIVKKQIQVLTRKTKQVSIQRVKIKTQQKQLTKQRGAIATKQKQLVKQKVTQKTKQKQKQLTRQKQSAKQKQKQLTKQRQKLLQKQKQLTKQRQKLITKFIKVPPPRLKVIIPKAKVPVGLIKRRKKRRKRIKVKPVIKQGYNVFGKHKRKFIRLNKVPLSKSQALDRGAFAIDKSTGATYKIVPVGKVKRLGKLTKGEAGHFSRTKKKYRSFRIKKGKKITLKNKYIEKRGKPRIDTRGEVKGLSLAKFAKQKGFIGKRPSKRKRKSTRRSTKRKVKRRRR